MKNWTSYSDKVVLVTGASSGIGLSMVKELANQGAQLVLVARSKNKLEETAQALRGEGTQVSVIDMDLSVSGSAKNLYTKVNELGLKVDLLINNAGYGRWGDFTEFELADYNQMIQLNITTLTELCHLFIADMKERKDGGIINVSSIAAFGPVPFGTVYSATKAYVESLTEALNYEYKEYGIHTMALCPGATESKFMEVATEKSEATRKSANKRMSSGSYMSSEAVAKEGLNAFLKGKVYHITGRNNRMMYAIMKRLPRKTVLNLSGNMFKNVVKG